MFRERIDQTPFTSEEANFQFKSIVYGNTPYAGDLSMLATLRAMFGERVGEDGAISAVYRNYELSKADSERFDDDKILRSALSGQVLDAENQLTILELVNSDTSGRVLGVIREKFCEKFEGWECIPKVEAFFAKSFPLCCYINRSTRSAILITDRLTLRKWHYIQIALFHCFPWFFTDEHPFDEQDKKLVCSLSEDNPSNYLRILADRASKYDFEKIRVKRLLSGFETVFEKRRMDSITNEIDCKRRDLESYNDRVSQLLAELRELNYKLIGLRSVIESHKDESQLMDYFLVDHRLGLENADGGDLRFTVKGYITDYVEDQVEGCLNNPRSMIYDVPGNERISKEDMALLIRAIFLDREIKLRTCAAFVLSAGGGRISCDAQDGKRWSAEFSTYMPNPHHQNYGCMGEFKRMINKLLQDGDYVGAVVQCETSCDSITWSDITVMQRFMQNMYKGTQECFELPDGHCVDQVGAVKWLKKED